MSNSTGRKFGTILTNKTLQDLENRKKISTKSVVFPENSIVCKEEPQPIKKVEPKLAELELSTVQKFPPNLEPVQQSGELKEDDDRRLYYARDFLLSFKEKCTESLEGILPEVRRENFPVRRPFTARPATPANQSIRSFRPQANSSSLLSILASPGGGVVYAATSDGKYVLPERESIHFLKNLRAPTAVTLQVALNSKEAPVSPSINRTPGRYVPPHKKAVETPVAKPVEEAKPLEAVVAPAEISELLTSATMPAVAPVPEARAKPEISMPKLITLEWKPKKVKKLKPRETDEKRLASRQKQIDIGKNTVGYKEFIAKVPKELRTKNDPKTPDKYQVCSKRSWDGQVRKWRRQLHAYDPAGAVADDLEEDLAGSESEDEDIEDDLEEIQRTEESLLPDKLKVAGSVSPKLFEVNGEPAIVV